MLVPSMGGQNERSRVSAIDSSNYRLLCFDTRVVGI